MAAGRQEIIVDLKGMVKDLLREFYTVTRGMKPERIVFYRDGVSEGQFREVYYVSAVPGWLAGWGLGAEV